MWAGLKNGTLLRAAEEHFDVLLTVDKGWQHQQNGGARRVAAVVLDAVGTTGADQQPLVPAAERVPLGAVPGSVTVVANQPQRPGQESVFASDVRACAVIGSEAPACALTAANSSGP